MIASAGLDPREGTDVADALKLGQRVPDFDFETYEPAKGDFGAFSLASQIEKKRWTILFFYPADFTFV
jgi:NADH-dependent peroxiredoxin subunit C